VGGCGGKTSWRVNEVWGGEPQPQTQKYDDDGGGDDGDDDATIIT
jgi:hypothetical protein